MANEEEGGKIGLEQAKRNPWICKEGIRIWRKDK